MGHFVTGIIGKPGVLQDFAAQSALPAPVLLPVGLALIPLRDSELDRILPTPQTGRVEDFEYLSDQLLDTLSDLSEHGRVMYFETEYFGGAGAQGAVVFEKGQAIYGPISAAIGPINEALSLLGVKTTPPALDQFETATLNRHRHTEDWLGITDDA
jgi:hypothetical protein